MNTEPKFGAFTSSVNPSELSQTITSILKIVGFVIGAVASLKGLDITISDESINATADAFAVIGTSILVIKEFGELVMAAVRRILARQN